MQSGQVTVKQLTRSAVRSASRIKVVLWMPVTAAKKTVFDRLSSMQIIFACIAVSALFHFVGGAAMYYSHQNDQSLVNPGFQKIEVAVIEEPETVKPEVIKKIEKPVKAKKAESDPVPQPIPENIAPPPPNEEADSLTPPEEIVGGVAESSTSDAGSFNVAVGNTLYAPPPEVAKAPEVVKPYKAKEYAAFHMVATAPVYQRNVDRNQLQKQYPDEARRLGIEKSISLKLLIDDDGTVVQVTVVRDPGYGFGEAAQRLAMNMLFSPATVNGVAVATEIPFTLKFSLE